MSVRYSAIKLTRALPQTGHNLPVRVTFQFLLVVRPGIELNGRYSVIKLMLSVPRHGQKRHSSPNAFPCTNCNNSIRQMPFGTTAPHQFSRFQALKNQLINNVVPSPAILTPLAATFFHHVDITLWGEHHPPRKLYSCLRRIFNDLVAKRKIQLNLRRD